MKKESKNAKAIKATKDRMKALNFEEFKNEVMEIIGLMTELFIKTNKTQDVMTKEIKKAHRTIEKMFKATGKAIGKLQNSVETLRWFTLCSEVVDYERRHNRSMSEKERVNLLKLLEYDPKEMKKEWEAEQRAAVNA